MIRLDHRKRIVFWLLLVFISTSFNFTLDFYNEVSSPNKHFVQFGLDKVNAIANGFVPRQWVSTDAGYFDTWLDLDEDPLSDVFFHYIGAFAIDSWWHEIYGFDNTTGTITYRTYHYNTSNEHTTYTTDWYSGSNYGFDGIKYSYQVSMANNYDGDLRHYMIRIARTLRNQNPKISVITPSPNGTLQASMMQVREVA